MKFCIKCKENKDLSCYGKNKNCKDGLVVYCKPCFKIIKKINDKKYSKSEKGKIARAKAWKKYASRPEIKINRNKKRKLLKDRESRQKQLRRLFDPTYKLTCSVRRRLLLFLKSKGLNKTHKFKDYIGCSKEELKNYLESKFQLGMTWQNHGQWHIDHIKPLASAKNENEVYDLCHYTNLQPLWKNDHILKTIEDNRLLRKHNAFTII